MAGRRTLEVVITGDASDASRAFNSINGDAAGSTTALQNFGVAAAAAIGVAGLAAFNLGSNFSDARGEIARATGAVGDDLDGLYNDFKGALGQLPDDMQAVSASIGAANTLFGATGDELTDVTVRLHDFSRLAGGDATSNMEQLGRASEIFGLDAAGATTALDDLYRVSQNYGPTGDALLGQLQQFGPLFANAGFSMSDTAVIMGQLHAAGVDITRVGPGLNRFFREVAEAGGEPQQALAATVEQIRDAQSASEALNLATEAFGAEGAQRLTTAIREGGLQVEDLGGLLGDTTGLIDETAAATATATERFRELWNRGLVFIEPALTAVFNGGMRVLDVFEHVGSNFDRYRPIIIGVSTALGVGLVTALGAALAANTALLVSMAATAAPFIATGAAIAGLVAGFVWLYDTQEWFRQGVDGLVTFFRDDVVPTATATGEAIGAGFETAFNVAAPFISHTVDQVGRIITIGREVIGFFHDVFTGDWESALNRLGTIASTAVDFITAPFDLLIDFLGGLPGRAAGAASGMWDFLGDGFRSAINWVIEKWNSISFTLPTMEFDVPLDGRGPYKFGGQSFGVPGIDPIGSKHAGGLVVPPSGQQEATYVLRRGERVLTPGQAVAATGGGGMGLVKVMIGTQEIVNALIEHDRNVEPILPRLQGGRVA